MNTDVQHDRQQLRLELLRLAGAKLPIDIPADEIVRFAQTLETYVTQPVVSSERVIGFVPRAA
ncbi:MAG: hypothetical protein M3145_11080 [Pseudomonadota bacterium]|nr:hypothetical protein [Pseudomonadota bacterium]